MMCFFQIVRKKIGDSLSFPMIQVFKYQKLRILTSKLAKSEVRTSPQSHAWKWCEDEFLTSSTYEVWGEVPQFFSSLRNEVRSNIKSMKGHMLGILNVSYRYLSQPQVGHKCQSKVMGHCDTPFQSCRGFDKYIFDVVGLLDAQKKLAIDPTILESKVDQLRIFDRNQVKFGGCFSFLFFCNDLLN